jgi:NADPH-dependent curcumin reductase CurA
LICRALRKKYHGLQIFLVSNRRTLNTIRLLIVSFTIATLIYKTAMEYMSTYIVKIPEARAALANWILAGKLKYFEHITKGFENAPKAFVGMYKGENFGKAIVQV